MRVYVWEDRGKGFAIKRKTECMRRAESVRTNQRELKIKRERERETKCVSSIPREFARV